MSTIYADFNTEGEFIGFYDNEIHSLIPQTAKIISNEVHLNFLENQGIKKINFETLELENIIKTQEEIDKENQVRINCEARKFLADTDCKVIRQRDQLTLEIETSLTNEEYLNLLQERQEARKKVINNVVE